MKEYKILLLCGPSDTSAIVYNYLKTEYEIVGVVVEAPKTLRERVKSRIRFIKWRIKKLGLFTTFGQVLFSVLIDYRLRQTSRKRKEEILRCNGLSDKPIDESALIYVDSHNSDKTISVIQQKAPDIIVVNGTSILRPRLLNSTKIPFINTHMGITPKYRGVHGMYWALANKDEENAGVTVHFIDKGVDTGNIILQAHTVASDEDNFATYPYLQISEGVKILSEAIRQVLNNEVKECVAGMESRQYFHPTLFQYLRHRVRLGVK